MGLQKRHREILQALYDLGGEATLGQIAHKLNLHINGLSQSFGARADWFVRVVEFDRPRGTRARDGKLRLVAAQSHLRALGVRLQNDPLVKPQPTREPTLDHSRYEYSAEVVRNNGDGLNDKGTEYLLRCLRWIYGGYVLSDTHHPSTGKLKDGEARIIENRARNLAAEFPCEQVSRAE